VNAVFSWDEWQQFDGTRETLACDDCGMILDTYTPDAERIDMPDRDTQEAKAKQAYDLGAEHGRNAASWYFDGNAPEGLYKWVLQGLAEGDPEVYDTFLSSPLSGEWAGDPTPRDVWEQLDVSEDDGAADDYIRMYEDGFGVAYADEVERIARLHV